MDDDAFNPVHVRHSIGRSSTSAAAEAAVSRQKSCNACVRGKRRCDKTKPRCTRCAVRGLDCVYHTRAPRRPSAGSPSTSSPSSSSSAAVSVAGGGGPTAASSGDHLPGLSADFDMGGFDAYDLGSSGTGTTSSGGTLELDPSLDFSIADLIGAGAGTGSSLWNIPGLAEPKANYPVPVPVSPPPYQPIRDLAILEASCISECVSAETHQVHDPRSRVGFVVSQLAEMHTTFARTRALPFIHPHLYARHVPRCIMSAFCAATAYANRTPATKGWVVRLVAGAAREIQEEGRRVSGTTQTPAEHLAKVQALLLVDTIRIFDGDISMRHAAEKERAVLQEWMKELVDVVKELPQYYEAQHGSKALRNRPPKSWDHWVLVESMKRTILMAMAFECLVAVLKSEPLTMDLWQPIECYTASRHLWEAGSSVDFFRAWREQPQWTITDFDFSDFWQYGRAEDMDDFTKLMLTIQVGLDTVEHFIQGDTSIPIPQGATCSR